VLFHKTDTTVASGMVENARNQLDSAKKRVKKSLSWPKNQFDRVDSGNILSLIKNILSREYSLTGNGIFLFCQENILSLLDDVADDRAMWTLC
jgi:hypothetical protein